MRYYTRPLTPEARQRLAADRRPRTHSPFQAKWLATLDLLDRELHMLGVRDEFVLQIDCTEADLRLDGGLRANARPTSPAVAVAISSRTHGDLLFACGRFHEWQDNVRAIALGLEALRKVERYGITQSNEQYCGWQALPPGTPLGPAMTVDEAADIIASALNGCPGQAEVLALWSTDGGRLYRQAARRHHPDVGGDQDEFRRITQARDILDAHVQARPL